MKAILTILSALFLILLSISTAHAVTCARGAYHAGCAGPNGAAVNNRGYANTAPPRGAVAVTPNRSAVVVTQPAPRCAWVNGTRVCR